MKKHTVTLALALASAFASSAAIITLAVTTAQAVYAEPCSGC